MSILILDMEMPKNCYGCPFFKQVDYWNKKDEADILSKCKRTGEFTWESVNRFLPNCPLVPVPEHGRLIDADRKTFPTPHRSPSNDYMKGWNACLRSVQQQPTIIPASKGTLE